MASPLVHCSLITLARWGHCAFLRLNISSSKAQKPFLPHHEPGHFLLNSTETKFFRIRRSLSLDSKLTKLLWYEFVLACLPKSRENFKVDWPCCINLKHKVHLQLLQLEQASANSEARSKDNEAATERLHIIQRGMKLKIHYPWDMTTIQRTSLLYSEVLLQLITFDFAMS